ncbi:phosphatase domain-containing protein [Roseivivax sp. CAU 1761]
MLKRVLARVAHPVEEAVDRVLFRSRPERVAIDPYLGYAGPENIVLRGRVLSALRRTDPDPEASRWVNLKQMAGLFLTREVHDVTVRVGGVSAQSDEEGYFTLLLPRDGGTPGWRSYTAQAEGGVETELEALIADPAAPFGVISDIDDTVMETGAYSLARNLVTSLTGNALTRHIFPDAVELMKAAAARRAPIYYVSSSPWNLHHFLTRIFARHGLPRGPIFLRDLGISRTQFISGTHGDHKGAAIDALLAAHPDLPFVMMGDTGQHDPGVYLAAAQRHPGRIVKVLLREPGKGADPRDLADIRGLEALGIAVAHAPSFEGMTLPDTRPEDPAR